MPKLKPRATPALIFLLLIGFAQSASAADWMPVGGDEEDGMSAFIDLDSVQIDKYYDDIVSVWIKFIYPDEYTMLLFEFDFSDRTYRLLAAHQYDLSGKRIDSDTNPTSWEHIIPESNGEYIYLTLKDYLNW